MVQENPANSAGITDIECDENGNPIVQGAIVRAENDVAKVQEWALNIPKGDGIWGDDTTRGFRDKLKEIQEQNGLEATGKLNKETKKAIRDEFGDDLADSIDRLEDKGITNYQLSEPDCTCDNSDADFISPDIVELMPSMPKPEITIEPYFPDAKIDLNPADPGPPIPDEDGHGILGSKADHVEYEGSLTVDDIYADLRTTEFLGGNTIGLDESTLRTPALEGLANLIWGDAKDMEFSQVMDDLRNGTGIAEEMSIEDRATMLDKLEPLEKHLANNVEGTELETALIQSPEEGSFTIQIEPDAFEPPGSTYAGDPTILEQLQDFGMSIYNALFEQAPEPEAAPTVTAAAQIKPDTITI